MEDSELKGNWAVILGASSGFGAAASMALAKAGVNICGVHLDMRSTLPNAQKVAEDIKACGVQALFFNVNAADAEKRANVRDSLQQKITSDGGTAKVRVMLHSLAFGSLRPYITSKSEEALTQKQMEMTLDVMSHSIVYWAQELVRRGLMTKGGRIFALTSGGSSRVISSYGAVSAAKASLESHIRQLAFELATQGITANALRAGVTDTPALRKIPASSRLLDGALARNPSGRLTTPEDVGAALVALSQPSTYWITGNIINVDGGEEIVA